MAKWPSSPLDMGRQWREGPGPNVVSQRGGRWWVAPEEYSAFLSRVWHVASGPALCLGGCPPDGKLYFSEVAQDPSRFFVDIDSDVHLPCIAARLERVVNRLFADEYRAYIATRLGSHNVHAVFPELVLSKEDRRLVTRACHKEIPQVDLRASGLRLPGCYGRSRGTAYTPFMHALSIFPAEGQVAVAPLKDRTSMKQLAPHMNGTKRKGAVATTGKHKMRKIRAHSPHWARLEDDKTKVLGKNTFVTVKGPGATHCELKGGKHKSNRVWFIVKDGVYFQRCFDCKGEHQLS